jgi:signal transduction histidine kinase
LFLMRYLLRGHRSGLLAFVLIATLVVGGLGWVTRAALELDGLRREQQQQSEQYGRLREAMWRLDRVASLLAGENSRPFNHFNAVFVPPLALNGRGMVCDPGTIIEPSPLLGVDLPEWMLLHFQLDEESGWESPQVLSTGLARRLRPGKLATVPLTNVTPAREKLLARLQSDLPPEQVFRHARLFTAEATTRDRTLWLARQVLEQDNPANPQSQQMANSADYVNRSAVDTRLGGKAQQERAQVYNKTVVEQGLRRNGDNWLNNGLALRVPKDEVTVEMSSMIGLWLPTRSGSEQLLWLRLVHVADKELCQGVVLDGVRLQEILLSEVRELFPEARLLPVRPGETTPPESTMTALPFQLDPGPMPGLSEQTGWSPLAVGLTLAWVAAGVALLAVGLGGWSLIDLSERRFRFVSAVTHELRTPLTTLRLYLDMLLSGLVREEGQQADYLRTLHAEADRLHRLVANVLDFSRLEKQRPRLSLGQVEVGELLGKLQQTWQGRCTDAGKELVIESSVPVGTVLLTDAELLQQVLGNLIDNACKYSREADDARLWLRAEQEGHHLFLEVEDRGPGIHGRERHSIFRAFQRGRAADTMAGGVGLGLALAQRWSRLLGARLELVQPKEGGACFRVRFTEVFPAAGVRDEP